MTVDDKDIPYTIIINKTIDQDIPYIPTLADSEACYRRRCHVFHGRQNEPRARRNTGMTPRQWTYAKKELPNEM